MTHADINDLEIRDYIFKIGDRGKAIQARYDKDTDALIFPRAVFDYVCALLNEALSQEPNTGKCRTCKFGECYNDAWCRCTHPQISGVRVNITRGCEVEQMYGIKEPYKAGKEELEQKM